MVEIESLSMSQRAGVVELHVQLTNPESQVVGVAVFVSLDIMQDGTAEITKETSGFVPANGTETITLEFPLSEFPADLPSDVVPVTFEVGATSDGTSFSLQSLDTTLDTSPGLNTTTLLVLGAAGVVGYYAFVKN